MSNWITQDQEPLEIFADWYEKSLKENFFEPTSMTLSTLDFEGNPDARVVLLKDYSQEGLCFFTNYDSDKGHEMAQNPNVSLLFHWQKPLHRQVRMQGTVEKLSFEENKAYFQTRPRGSQIGAWASPQSHVIQGRDELLQRVKEWEKKFDGQEVPCPENWGGYRMKPLKIEFWQAEEYRLHNRIRFKRPSLSEVWSTERLAP